MHIGLDIVFDGVDLNDIFSDVVVLNIGNLGVFLFLHHQIVQVIVLHLLNDFDQLVVKSRSEVELIVVFFF